MNYSVIAMSILVLSTGTAGAAVYKWVDENGQVHYGDKPNAISGAEKIKIPKQRFADPAALKRINDHKALLNKREQERIDAKKNQIAAKQKSENYAKYCTQTKKRLEILLQERPVYYEEQKGKRSYISDEDRAKKIKADNEYVNQHCK